MPSFPTRLAATAAAAALVLTALAAGPAQAAGPSPASAGTAPATTAAASTATGGVAADLSRDMMKVPAAPLLEARTDDAVSPATGVTTHPVYVSVATVTATTSDDSPTPPDDASVRAAVTQLHDYWWEESGHTVDVTLAGIETRPLDQASCVPATVLNTVHASAFGGRFAKYAWAGTNEHLIVLSRETCGTTATAFGTVGGDGGEVFSSYGVGAALGVPVLLHEFGHNLGFGHAGAGMCRSTTSFDGAASDYRYATSTDTPAACPVLEYGDFLDIMGYSISSARPHLSSAQRVRAGFLTDVTTLSGAGTARQVVVASLDGTAKGRALKVVDPISGQDYYVEYRTATGTDASSAEFGGRAASCALVASGFTRCALTSDKTTGSVRVLRPLTLAGSTVSTVALAVGLDAKRDPSRRDTHLDAGESFTSANGGFTVSVRSMTPSGGAVLDVTLAGAAKQQPVAAPAPAAPVATTSTLTVDRTRQTYGSPTRITATTRVATVDGSAPAGTVTLRDGTAVVGSTKVGTDGRAAVTLPATTRSGAHALRASFVPDTTAQARSDSATVAVTVDKAPSTSALSTGTTPVKRNAAASVTVTVAAPGVARPDGVVTVTAGGKVLGTTRLTSTGGGRVSVPVTSFTRAGVYALTASYAGTDDLSASVSKRMIVVVR